MHFLSMPKLDLSSHSSSFHVDESEPMLDKLKRKQNRQIDAMTEQEVIDMLYGVEDIEHITAKPENITNNDSSKNVKGGINKKATTKKDEKLCKGVKVQKLNLSKFSKKPFFLPATGD